MLRDGPRRDRDLRGHPKNRHRWNSAARQLLGDLYGRQPL